MFGRKSQKIPVKTVRTRATEIDREMRAQLISLRKAIQSRINGQIYLTVSPPTSPVDEPASKH
jgi:hypothetical protein